MARADITRVVMNLLFISISFLLELRLQANVRRDVYLASVKIVRWLNDLKFSIFVEYEQQDEDTIPDYIFR